jgi:hypothetical protein
MSNADRAVILAQVAVADLAVVCDPLEALDLFLTRLAAEPPPAGPLARWVREGLAAAGLELAEAE